MSTLLRQIPLKERHDLAEPDPEGEGQMQAALDRIAAAEQRLRVTLQHSVNAPMTFDLTPEEAEALRGRTLSEAIEALLAHTDPVIAESIRQTLTDPAVLVEVGRHPARPNERIDQFLAQGEVSLGVSRSMRGGRNE